MDIISNDEPKPFVPPVPLVITHFPDYLDYLSDELVVQPPMVNNCTGLTFKSEAFIRGLAARCANQTRLT